MLARVHGARAIVTGGGPRTPWGQGMEGQLLCWGSTLAPQTLTSWASGHQTECCGATAALT